MCAPDPHAPGGQYRIRSLYFDTPSDKALREKLNGEPDAEGQSQGQNHVQQADAGHVVQKAGLENFLECHMGPSCPSLAA